MVDLCSIKDSSSFILHHIFALLIVGPNMTLPQLFRFVTWFSGRGSRDLARTSIRQFYGVTSRCNQTRTIVVEKRDSSQESPFSTFSQHHFVRAADVTNSETALNQSIDESSNLEDEDEEDEEEREIRSKAYRKHRIDQLEALRKTGYNPYPYNYDVALSINEFRAAYESVEVCGESLGDGE